MVRKGTERGPLSANLQTPPADFTKPFSQWKIPRGISGKRKIFETSSNGVPGTAKAKFHYSEDERWVLSYTVMAFSKEEGR